VMDRSVVAGAAVRLAVRLERRAEPNDILLDEATWRLVRNAVRVEPTGAEDEQQAFRILELRTDAPAFERRFDAPFVGREAERQLILIFEDIHWAEPPVLDLIEHVADFSRDSPILVLCLARPELLDDRSGWAGGKPNATTILLDPLPEDEARRLADWLVEPGSLPDEVRANALRVAEGNPLFLEQLLAFAAEGGGAEGELFPPTVEALLAARLDRLGPAERAVVERAALIGRDFDVDALSALAPEPLRLSIPA